MIIYSFVKILCHPKSGHTAGFFFPYLYLVMNHSVVRKFLILACISNPFAKRSTQKRMTKHVCVINVHRKCINTTAFSLNDLFWEHVVLGNG